MTYDWLNEEGGVVSLGVYECKGGPYHGKTLLMADGTSAIFTVQGWHGYYLRSRGANGSSKGQTLWVQQRMRLSEAVAAQGARKKGLS